MATWRLMLVMAMLLCAALVGALVGGLAGATAAPQPQVAPRPISIEITTAAALTPEQQLVTKNWAEYWTAALSAPNATAAEVEKARDELLRPLDRMNRPVAAFRMEYSKHLVPALQPTVKSGNLHTSVNALIVIWQLGTDAALRTLLTHADPTQEKRTQVRLHAVKGCRKLFETDRLRGLLEAGVLQPPKVPDAARRLKDAVKTETDPFILQRLFEAIAAADNEALDPSPGGETRVQVRDQMVEAFTLLLGKIKENKAGPDPRIEPLQNAIYHLRNGFINWTGPEQTRVGAKLGPALGDVWNAAQAHWDSAHADSQAALAYQQAVDMAEEFLKIIDAALRGQGKAPKTELQDAWKNADKAAFEAGLKSWADVLVAQPYKQ